MSSSAVTDRAVIAVALVLVAACGPSLTPIAGRGPAVAPEPSRPVTSSAALSERDYLRARELMVPVDGVTPERLVDNFAAPRGSRRHNALDILAPRGTPVLAADDGRVYRVGSNTLGGLTVYALDVAERFIYYYAHLDAYRDGLREGMPLAQGDVIGYVGTTGNAPAHVPHLHFQAMRFRRDRYWAGEPVNPKPYLVAPGARRQPGTTATDQR